MMLAAVGLGEALTSSTVVAGTLGGAIGAAIVIFTLGSRVGGWRKEVELRLANMEKAEAETGQEVALGDKFAGVLELLAELIKVRVTAVEAVNHDILRRLEEGDKRFDVLTTLAERMKSLEATSQVILKEISKRPTRRECDLRHGLKPKEAEADE